jgi:maltose alpha-D-glucosyltransferase/alpha-amylase
MVALAKRSFRTLRGSIGALSGAAGEEARRVLSSEAQILDWFRPIRDQRVNAIRIRHHGDFHLDRVLYTGKDFVISGFDGDPDRPLSEGRIKRSPLRDVASMLRSMHYASVAALFGEVPGIIPDSTLSPSLESWARFWYSCVAATFLKGYQSVPDRGLVATENRHEFTIMLNAFLMEKAVAELEYELTHRPDWVRVPLRGILGLLETREEVPA